MTLRTKTLTALAALTLSTAVVWAQTPQVVVVPPEQAGTTEGGVTLTQNQDGSVTVTHGTEAAAETPAEAPAAEPEAPAVAEPAPAAEAPAEQSADEPEAEVAVEGQATPEPVDTAEPVSEATAEAPDGTAAEPGDAEASESEPAVVETESAAGDHEAAEEAEASASHGAGHIEDISFSFEGPFGKYDQFQLQRGLQVYTEVCAACHGMKFVPLRTLADAGGPGLPEDQVRAYAAQLSIFDPELEDDRPRLPTDHFPTVSGEGMGPDLSLMAKARAGFHGPYGTGISQLFRGIGGPEYIHAILTGYDGETSEQAGTTLYHNSAFAGNWIGMPEPLQDDQVTYEDGTPATVDQMARDVSAFLMWTAEPKMMDRKQVGLISVLFLIVLTVLLYLTNKRIWAPYKHHPKD